MKLKELEFGAQPPVDGYGPGFFRVQNQLRHGPLLILPASGLTKWDGLDDLTPLIDATGQIDVLLLGMGANIANPPAQMAQQIETHNIPAEVMASPPACRTYNVLLGEGRRVGLAAIPV